MAQMLQMGNPDLAKVGVEGSSPFARSRFPINVISLRVNRARRALSATRGSSFRGHWSGQKSLPPFIKAAQL